MTSRRAAIVAIAAVALAAATGLSAGFAAGLNLSSQPLTTYRTCTITGTPATTAAVADATVRQGSPNNNFGTTNTMEVVSGSGVNRRIYIRFDLAQCSPVIPSTATVRVATLRLYLSGLPAVCRTINIFRATATWGETTLTWNNQPFGTAINNPPSGSATDSFDAGTPVGCQNRVAGYVTGATVTADVAAFVAGSATNFGWMLRDSAEGSGTTRTSTFSAKNLGTLTQAPQLVVTYARVP